MGSSLEIKDIIEECQWTKGSDHYVPAMHMFERIIDGQFIDRASEKVQEKLLVLIQTALEQEPMEEAPDYYMKMFRKMIDKMSQQYISDSLWINTQQISKIKNEPHCNCPVFLKCQHIIVNNPYYYIRICTKHGLKYYQMIIKII